MIGNENNYKNNENKSENNGKKKTNNNEKSNNKNHNKTTTTFVIDYRAFSPFTFDFPDTDTTPRITTRSSSSTITGI